MTTKSTIPPGLSATSRKLWNEVTQAWELDPDRLAILAVALRALTRCEEAEATVKTEGMMLTDPSGRRRSHPLLVVIREERSGFLGAMRQLSLEADTEGGTVRRGAAALAKARWAR
jgi:hypothetical protein